jgi:hypothetical protein
MTKRKAKRVTHPRRLPVHVRIDVGWLRPWLAKLDTADGRDERHRQQHWQPEDETCAARISLKYGDIISWQTYRAGPRCQGREWRSQHDDEETCAADALWDKYYGHDDTVYPSKEAAVQAAVARYREGLADRRACRREKRAAVDLRVPWANICAALGIVALLSLGALLKRDAKAQLKEAGFWEHKRRR